MNRCWSTLSALVIAAHGAALAIAQTSPPTATPPVPAATQSAATPALEPFVRAFNSHNAEALATLWSENGLHVAEDSGKRLEGRAAIAKAYGALFAGDPKCQLKIQAEAPRQIAPSVISVDGVAEVTHTENATTRSKFSAILTKVGPQWLVSEVREREMQDPATSSSPLVRLDWLVGAWTGASDGSQIDLEMHWAENQRFLMGRLTQQSGGHTTSEVFHIIGWDGEQQCMRSWQFSGDGGFAEGVWQPDGDAQWLNKLVFKYPDGRRGSMIHVLNRVSNDQFTLRTIDREVEGQLEPNSGIVRLTRGDSRATPPSAGNATTTATSPPAGGATSAPAPPRSPTPVTSPRPSGAPVQR